MESSSLIRRFINALERNAWKVIISALLLTALLSVPMIIMPMDDASLDPKGEVFDLQEDINNRFEAPFHQAAFIVEARGQDILTQASLWELYQNSQRLLRSDAGGELAPDGLPSQPYLYTIYDPDTKRYTVGVLGSVAHAVQQTLVNDPTLNISLEHATDAQVKTAIHRILSSPEADGLRAFLAKQSLSEKRMVDGEEIDYWTSPATVFSVLADNEKLGGGTFQVGVGRSQTIEDKEQFNRNVQDLLRGDQTHYRLWGIAIDVNLESADEGLMAGIFIMLTVIAAVLIVWISLRSYWAMVLTGAGLGVLIVWLKGVSALFGLKGGLVIDMIVPIAMISLGVDFAIHSIRRYQEGREEGLEPRMALRVGLVGVMGALLLAMLSDSIAFLSNIFSNIESVIHFGIAAGIAVVSSFIVLGVVVPLALMRIDQILMSGSSSSTSRVLQIFNLCKGIGIAVLFGAAVIFLIAVSKLLGLAVLATTILIFLIVPVVVMHQRQMRNVEQKKLEPPEPARQPQGFIAPDAVECLVMKLASLAPVVVMVTALVTGLSVWFAMKLEPSFDVKDFLDYRSDFVVSLDKLDRHIGAKAGEPSIVYIRGDLTDPQALVAIDDFIVKLTEIPEVARFDDGEVMTGNHVLSLIRGVTSNEFAVSAVTLESSVVITDSDGDGIPDTPRQVKAVYDFIVEHGLPLNPGTMRLNPSQVRQVLYHDIDSIDDDVAIFEVPIVGSREQAIIDSARKALEARLDLLEANPSISIAGLSGAPFTRDSQLRATTNSLQTSIPIATAGVFVLLLIVMRSLRYAVVTIIPIGLVVAWLYGVMYVSGFALNFVTATIGAVSVGVGIDYSIHMTERFREELRRTRDKVQALRRTARGTGLALIASATSSIVGFFILGLAPMPMFASYGRLTAIMIFLALASSLVVLPSLLFLVTRSNADSTGPFEKVSS